MKRNQAGFTLFELILVIAFVGGVGTGLYVLGHFISKFW